MCGRHGGQQAPGQALCSTARPRPTSDHQPPGAWSREGALPVGLLTEDDLPAPSPPWPHFSPSARVGATCVWGKGWGRVGTAPGGLGLQEPGRHRGRWSARCVQAKRSIKRSH